MPTIQIRFIRGRGIHSALSQPPERYPTAARRSTTSAVIMSPDGLNAGGEQRSKEHFTTYSSDVCRRRRRRSRPGLGFATLVSLVVFCAIPIASAFMSPQARVARLSALGKYRNESPLALAAAGRGRVTSRRCFQSTMAQNSSAAQSRRCVFYI